MNVNPTRMSGSHGPDPDASQAAACNPARNPAAFRNLVDGRAAIEQGRQMLDDARASAEEHCRDGATGCGPAVAGLGLALGFIGAYRQLTEWGEDLGDAVCDATDCDAPDTADETEQSDGSSGTDGTSSDETDESGVIDAADADAEGEEAPADEEGIVGRLPISSEPDASSRDANLDEAWR